MQYSGGIWTRNAYPGASGGYVKQTSTQGATAKLTFTGSSVSLWAHKNSNSGRASIYVDGYYDATIDLYSSSYQAQRVVYTYVWPTSGNHKIEIKVADTSGRPYVNVDAFTLQM